jgi:hypothetical protein
MEKMNKKKKEGVELEKEEDEGKTLKALIKVVESQLDKKGYYPASLKLLKRIMELSMEELTNEAVIEKGEESVLHYAAGLCFPLNAISRLLEAVGIDAQDSEGNTIAMICAYDGFCDLLNELVSMKVDLSIVNSDGENIFEFVIANRSGLSSEEIAEVLKVLAKHSVTSAKITKGFRSNLHESVFIAEPKRLAEEGDDIRFYLRTMSLMNEELQVEAKECDEDGNNAIITAAGWEDMDEAIKRLQQAWPSSVDAQNNDGENAIINAAFFSKADNVHLLATMETDLSLEGEDGDNVFDEVEYSKEKAAVYSVLAEHGVTSSNIPAGFQSPLYFTSKYYDANLREQHWIERRVFMMCLDRVFDWSKIHQIESERLMTLPTDLPSDGMLVAHCCMNVDASSVSNGIARLIMQFAFGFNRRLIGMPREGAGLEDDDDDDDE